jgi:hypothetical protein
MPLSPGSRLGLSKPSELWTRDLADKQVVLRIR